jgi:PleD family two-component response regulator
VAKILLVDSDRRSLNAAERALAAVHHDVVTADSASDAQRLLEESFNYDLIIASSNMSSVSGEQLLHLVRADPRTRAIRFILLCEGPCDQKGKSLAAHCAVGGAHFALKADDLVDEVDSILKS